MRSLQREVGEGEQGVSSAAGGGRSEGDRREAERGPSPAAEAANGRGAAVRPMEAMDPEVSAERPKRRRFTAEYKRRVLDKFDACSKRGEVGALLRREGLYSSLLSEWRQQRDAGTTLALEPKKRGRKAKVVDAVATRNAELERDIVRLKERLRKAEIIIDVQKKLSILLGRPLPDSEANGSDE